MEKLTLISATAMWRNTFSRSTCFIFLIISTIIQLFMPIKWVNSQINIQNIFFVKMTLFLNLLSNFCKNKYYNVTICSRFNKILFSVFNFLSLTRLVVWFPCTTNSYNLIFFEFLENLHFTIFNLQFWTI